MTQGYITVAFGKLDFLEQAVTLGCSILANDSKRQLAIVTDPVLASAAIYYKKKGIFQHVRVIDDASQRGFSNKLACSYLTPFDRTLYVDSDCLVVQKVEILWQHMDSRDFSIQGEIRTDGFYGAIPISSWLKELGIQYLPIFNGGCFSWNQRGKSVLERAAVILASPSRFRLPIGSHGFPDDQPAIGIAMAEQGMAPLPNSLDLHFSSMGATSPIIIDFKSQVCRFRKGTYWTEPSIFHYNSLLSEEMYKSVSRRTLEEEIRKLRSSFGLADAPWPRPNIKNKIGMMVRGQWHLQDPR